MALLTWNQTCSTGVRAMDDQHGILLDVMNELRLAQLHGSDREQVDKLLEQLVEFTRMHLWSEERLLELNEFPGLVEHRAEHRSLLSQMQESARRAQHSEGVQMRCFLRFLCDGFQEHMEGMDMEYGPWLNERGIF
jgi:hemerythrin